MRLTHNFSVLDLENYIKVTALNKKRWDLFICCSSFEDRSVRNSELFYNNDVHFNNTIIINFKETDPSDNKGKNLKSIYENLEKVSDNTLIFNSDSVSLPIKGIQKFKKFIIKNKIKIEAQSNIVIDITVIPKSHFFLLFKHLRDKYEILQCDVIYTEPDKYKSKVKGEIILTEGLDRVESIPGFSGSSKFSKDSLIVLLGFEGKRSLDVFNVVNPVSTYVINGFPSYQPGWHKISLEANLRFIKESKSSDHLYFAPAINPFITCKTIDQIVNDITNSDPESNVVVAPLGSKMQALGVLLYALNNNKIKVVYPFPSVYKADYSYGYGSSRIVKIKFSKKKSA